MTMLKVCSVSERTKLVTLNIDTDRYAAGEPVVIWHDRPKTCDIGSNMGRPCWFTIDPSQCSMIYDWNTYNPVSEPIITSPPRPYEVDFTRYACAGVIDNVAMVCRCYVGGSKIFTPFSRLYLGDRQIDGFIVEETGQRVFIKDNTSNINMCMPIGESMPFGWWVPSYEPSERFAACGQLLARVSRYNRGVSVWDTRVGEITDTLHEHIGVAAVRKCVFRGEYMIFVCSIHDGHLSTRLHDLRNPGTIYDLISADYNYPYITSISAF